MAPSEDTSVGTSWVGLRVPLLSGEQRPGIPPSTPPGTGQPRSEAASVPTGPGAEVERLHCEVRLHTQLHLEQLVSPTRLGVSSFERRVSIYIYP